MSGEKVAWLEPDSILDADFLRQLYEYHDFDTLTFDVFSQTLHDAGHDEIQDALRPFLKQLAPVRGVDGKPANKVKHKARALLLRKSDVKALVDVFGQQFKNRKAIQTFIERAQPEEVATALGTAASSDLAKKLPEEVQTVLCNRVSLITARSSSVQKSTAEASEDSFGEEAVLSTEYKVTQPVQTSLDFLQGFDPQTIIQDYSSVMNQMSPPQIAPKQLGRPSKPVEASTGTSKSTSAPLSASMKGGRPRYSPVEQSMMANARKSYPSPSSPGPSSSLPATTNMAPASVLTEELVAKTAGTEPKPSKATKKRKHASAMGLDGQADLYDLPVSSPSSKDSDALHVQTVPRQFSTLLPSQKTKKVNGAFAAKSSKPQKPMSAAEDQLLKESLGLIPKTSSSIHSVKDTRSESRQSTPKSVQSLSNEEDDLLQQCLKSTPQNAEDDLLRACLESTSRKSLKTSHVPAQPTAAFRIESVESQKAQPAPTATPVVDNSTPGKVLKKTKKSKRASSAASMSNVTDFAELSNQITSLFKQSESKTAHNYPATTSAPPAERANKSSKIAKRVPNSDTARLQRRASPELPFTPPSKNLMKRKRKSLDRDADLDEGDTLEVDESVYDSEGNRMEQSPAVKVTKKKEKKKKKKPKHEDSGGQSASQTAQAQAPPGAVPKQHKKGSLSQPESFWAPNELLIDVKSDEGTQSANIDTQPDEAVTEASLIDRLNTDEEGMPWEAGKRHSTLFIEPTFLEGTSTSIVANIPKIKAESASDRTTSSPSSTSRRPRSAPVTPRKRTGLSSPFFTTPSSSKKCRPSPGTVSSIEAPPLSHKVFGLIQEELADDPFKLIVAVIYLNRTRATIAIPKFRTLIERYPTAEDVAHANVNDIADFIQPLGLHNQRAATIVNLANVWISNPPVVSWRFKTPGYPTIDASKDIKADEVLSDVDSREGAFEVGHISGLGAYAWDSWRIFCRDNLRGLAESWNGEAAMSRDFEPEWKRVLPKDKELRAFLRWMWLKEGWKWDPLTGEKEVASEELMRRAQEGGIQWDEDNF